jgi:hypothetical protein
LPLVPLNFRLHITGGGGASRGLACCDDALSAQKLGRPKKQQEIILL